MVEDAELIEKLAAIEHERSIDADAMNDERRLCREIKVVLNRYSAENVSNTPDFILAQYLLDVLAAWNTAVQQRETWYGRGARPSEGMLANKP